MPFSVTSAVAQGMLGDTGLREAIDAGTAAVINIYNGTMPTDADAAQSNTLLAQLVCSAVAFSGITMVGNNARATFAAIANDASADATGTATHFRILTQNAGTVIGQGSVGTASADMILNTVAITAGSVVAITSATIDLPKL